TLNYTGDGSGQQGGISLSGGTLELNYISNTAAKFSGSMLLNGGTLFYFPNSATPLTQSVTGNTFVTGGHNDVIGSGTGTLTLAMGTNVRSEEHTSELQSHLNLVCRLLLEKKKSHID